MIEIIAFITMFLDHLGVVFDNIFLRIIGRLAMPLFAFGIYKGLMLSNNLSKYATRLLVLGLISTVPYHFFAKNFHVPLFNVLFTFSLVVWFEVGLSRFVSKPQIKDVARLFVLTLLPILQMYNWVVFEYQLLAPLFIYAYYYGFDELSFIGESPEHKNLIIQLSLIFIYIFSYVSSWEIQMFSIVGYALPYFLPKTRYSFIGRWVYLIYPIQYVLFALLRR